MEPEYIIDTNVAIDYLDNKLPDIGSSFIVGITFQISVITRMELLSWTNAADAQLKVLQQFVNESFEYSLTESVIVKAIALRKTYKIKLPDAIIAATALVHGLTLLTRNMMDFHKIKDLLVVNPHEK